MAHKKHSKQVISQLVNSRMGANEISLALNKEYSALLNKLKSKIRGARLKAALAVNHEVIKLYWHIGKQIIDRHNWGSKLINTLSQDLQNAFPETRGFSVRSLQRMRQFASYYPCFEIVPQPVAQLPWGHISLLIHKVKDDSVRAWYAEQATEQGWSRITLERYISNNLYESQGLKKHKTTNFLTNLSSPQSELAHDLIKSPYNFDFLGLHDTAHERDIEHASIQHIAQFILELGKGFAFVGHQVPIAINDNEFFLDMLFYNLKLRCYTVIEIKSTKFKPEHAGQLNFYLSAVDDLLKHPDDNPSIGLLLCKSRDKIVAEYALKGMTKPIGVSEYELTKKLPKKFAGVMPTIKEIENELSAVKRVNKK